MRSVAGLVAGWAGMVVPTPIQGLKRHRSGPVFPLGRGHTCGAEAGEQRWATGVRARSAGRG